MNGMSATSGKRLSGIEHIQQSVADILSTPVGSRVMRREYGSVLPSLIDQPLNGATLLRAYAAVITALNEWEPRIRVERVINLVRSNQPGTALIDMEVLVKSGDGQERQSLSVSVNTGRVS